MVKINFKVCLLAALLLFVFIGAASASENVTDTVSADIDNSVPVSSGNDTIDIPAGEKVRESADNDTPAVIKKPTKIVTKSVSGKQKKNVKLAVTLKDSTGKVIKNSYVTFKYSGKTYKVKTNSYGKATITVKLPNAKYYKTVKTKKGSILTVKKVYRTIRTCTVTYAGSNDYNASSAKFKVTATKSSVVKKYRYHKYRYMIVPHFPGRNAFSHGKMKIATEDATKKKIHYLTLVVQYKNKNTPFSAKLKLLKSNGKFKWQNSWKKSTDYGGVYGVFYYKNINKVGQIKVKVKAPYYTRIK